VSDVSASSAPAGWEHVYSGKVRDLYTSPEHPGRMLVVASDRISAFDQVLEPPVPGKGETLTALTLWWFGRLAGIRNHLVDDRGAVPAEVRGRAMLVRTLRMHPIECVVRGYLTGSGWREYQRSRSVCGVPLPDGLRDGDRLPEPIYTPAFKAELGQHDENIDFARTVELVGEETAAELRRASLEVFGQASEIAEQRGLLLADTKFEFGVDDEGRLVLGDEVLTSDSSRYWDAEAHASGRVESFDKQAVRDWMAERWDGTGTPPPLAPEVVERTTARYRELLARLTG